MFTTDSILARAAAFTSKTRDETILSVWASALGRADVASYAKHVTVFHASRVRTAKAAAALLDVSEQRVSRMNRGANLWLTCGISEAGVSDVRRPWTRLNGDAMVKWLTSKAGAGDLATIVDASTDSDKIAALLAVVPDVAPKAVVTPEDALLAVLARAVDLASVEGLALTDEHRAIIGDALATVASLTGAEVSALVTA